jgi:hypothetical protein
MTKTTRVLLRPEAAAQTLIDRAGALGWELVGDDARAHGRPAKRFWRPTSDSEVGWYEDHSTGVRFVWVTNAPHLENEMAALLPHYTREELLAAARGGDLHAALDALRALSVLEVTIISAELRELILRWMSHENRVVRRVILHLCWMGAWTAMLPEIDERHTTDKELGAAWGRLAKGLRKLSER